MQRSAFRVQSEADTTKTRKTAASGGGPPFPAGRKTSLDDLDDLAGLGFDQDRLIVDDGVAILGFSIASRHLSVSDGLRKSGTDHNLLLVGDRRHLLFPHIGAEFSTLIRRDTANDRAANGAAHGSNCRSSR